MGEAQTIVDLTRSHDALDAALSTPDLKQNAVNNPHLPADLWFRLYRKRPALKVAQSLAGRPLNAEQLTHLIATEERTAVIKAAALTGLQLSAEHLDMLLQSKALTATLANDIVKAYGSRLTEDWLRAATEVSGEARMRRFLADDDLTDDDIGQALLTYDQWGDKWDTVRRAELLARRPGLLRYAAQSASTRLRTTAAGCRHLTDPELQRQIAGIKDHSGPFAPHEAADLEFVWVALVCNPTCDLDVVAEIAPHLEQLSSDNSLRAADRLARRPFRMTGRLEDEDDTRIVEWVIRRTVPSQFGDGPVRDRQWDLAALMRNTHLTETLVAKIMTATRNYPQSVIADPECCSAMADLIQSWPDAAATADWTLDDVDGEPLDDPVAPSPDPVDTLAEDARTAGYWDEQAASVASSVDDAMTLVAGRYIDIRDGNVQMQHGPALYRQVALLDELVTGGVDAWMTVFRLVDGGFTGTTRQLAMVADAATSRQ